MNYSWNWRIFAEPAPDASGTYFTTLLSGLGWTLTTAISAWLIALVLGIFVGVLRSLDSRPANLMAEVWIEAFRNVPLLVQMFLWYFVVPELLPKAMGDWLKALPNAAFVTAVLSLGLFTSARVAVQTSAGLASLPRGQSMAAAALGLTRFQAYRHVLLPVGLRVVIPPLTSEFLNVIKNSAVALTIGLMELTARTRAMQEFSFQVFEAFTAATLIYLATNLIVVMGMRALERAVRVPGLSLRAEGREV